MALKPSTIIETISSHYPNLKDIPNDLEPTLNRMFQNEPHVIDRERFNIILSVWRLPPVGSSFFNHYFGEKIESAVKFGEGLHKFTKDALWHFGDIRRGFYVLRDSDEVPEYLEKSQFDVNEFKNRLPWRLVDNIKPLDRGFLGYVSGQRPYRQKEVLSTSEAILKEFSDNYASYEGLSHEAVRNKLTKTVSSEKISSLSELNGIKNFSDLDLFKPENLSKNKEIISEISAEVEETIEKVERLKKTGTNNQIQFLRNIEMIDVYVATSMRNDKEYVEMAEFVSNVFTTPKISSLNLRFFDPTLCFCKSRIDKGVIECLLVRTAKVTIYCAQEGDTFGKDSELAATLCQGKPVIVYVPDSDVPEIKEKLDNRARIFKEFHPLSLQVGLYDGVARGVIVVRSAEQCSRMLHKILTNSLDVGVHFEQCGVVLREKETNSVVRVMTGWGELSHAFWHNFGISANSKAGVPEQEL